MTGRPSAVAARAICPSSVTIASSGILDAASLDAIEASERDILTGAALAAVELLRPDEQGAAEQTSTSC